MFFPCWFRGYAENILVRLDAKGKPEIVMLDVGIVTELNTQDKDCIIGLMKGMCCVHVLCACAYVMLDVGFLRGICVCFSVRVHARVHARVRVHVRARMCVRVCVRACACACAYYGFLPLCPMLTSSFPHGHAVLFSKDPNKAADTLVSLSSRQYVDADLSVPAFRKELFDCFT